MRQLISDIELGCLLLCTLVGAGVARLSIERLQTKHVSRLGEVWPVSPGASVTTQKVAWQSWAAAN